MKTPGLNPGFGHLVAAALPARQVVAQRQARRALPGPIHRAVFTPQTQPGSDAEAVGNYAPSADVVLGRGSRRCPTRRKAD